MEKISHEAAKSQELHTNNACSSERLSISTMQKVIKVDENDPRIVLPYLLREFYRLGWCTGTGGAVSMRFDNRLYMAPSGVLKEMVRAKDLFVLDASGTVLDYPSDAKELGLTETQCAPMFIETHRERNAGAVLHLHSRNAVLVTLLCGSKREFRISHLEMVKGVRLCRSGRNCRYDEQLVLPIVENTNREADLHDTYAATLREYPETSCILVRRHGLYCWGPTWQSAKAQAEALDYIFDIAVKMHELKLLDLSADQ